MFIYSISISDDDIVELIDADPEELSSKISGASAKTVSEWQNNVRTLLKT